LACMIVCLFALLGLLCLVWFGLFVYFILL